MFSYCFFLLAVYTRIIIIIIYFVDRNSRNYIIALHKFDESKFNNCFVWMFFLLIVFIVVLIVFLIAFSYWPFLLFVASCFSERFFLNVCLTVFLMSFFIVVLIVFVLCFLRTAYTIWFSYSFSYWPSIKLSSY